VANHLIRLHGPWSVRPLENPRFGAARQCTLETDDGSSSSDSLQTIAFPQDWKAWCVSFLKTATEKFPTIELSRRFGLPTGLADGQKIWLTFEIEDCRGTVWLNDQELGTIRLEDRLIRFAIGKSLLARNQLQIFLPPFLKVTPPVFHAVRLEIESVG
jgi:hypothetical protein